MNQLFAQKNYTVDIIFSDVKQTNKSKKQERQTTTTKKGNS